MFVLPDTEPMFDIVSVTRDAHLISKKCLFNWTKSDFKILHNVLSQVGVFEYVRWELDNEMEIDQYCQSSRSQKRQLTKWKDFPHPQLLDYACWRRLIVAKLSQDFFGLLEKKKSSLSMRSLQSSHLLLLTFYSLEYYTPYWLGSFELPSPFQIDGKPLYYSKDLDFRKSYKTGVELPDFEVRIS